MHTQDDLAARLQQAEAIAKRAGALALDFFHRRDSLEIETKRALTDMVSIADKQVEDQIRAELKAAFPDDALLGEEHGLEDGTSGLTWAIDPIDGTAPFLNGLPGWCVSIGLVDDSGHLLGVIYAPVLDEMFVGGRGFGATLNGRKIQVTDRFDLSTGLLGVSANDRVSPARLGRMHGDLAAEGVAWVRYGSGALMLAYVAAGRLVGFCEPSMSLWDCAAAYALIEAAGGRIRPAGEDALAGNGFPVLAATDADYDRLAQIAALDDADWQLGS